MKLSACSPLPLPSLSLSLPAASAHYLCFMTRAQLSLAWHFNATSSRKSLISLQRTFAFTFTYAPLSLSLCRQSYARWIDWAWWWICHTSPRAPCATRWRWVRRPWSSRTPPPTSYATRVAMCRTTYSRRWPGTGDSSWLTSTRSSCRAATTQPYRMQSVSSTSEASLPYFSSLFTPLLLSFFFWGITRIIIPFVLASSLDWNQSALRSLWWALALPLAPLIALPLSQPVHYCLTACALLFSSALFCFWHAIKMTDVITSCFAGFHTIRTGWQNGSSVSGQSRLE